MTWSTDPATLLGQGLAAGDRQRLRLHRWPARGRARVHVLAPDRAGALLAVRAFSTAPRKGLRATTERLLLAHPSAMREQSLPGGASDAGSSLLDTLRRSLPTVDHLACRAGPPRANRKPVVMALDAHGTVLAVVKVAVNPLTRALLQAERDALVRLAGLTVPGVRTPRLLAAADDLLVLDALPLRDARPMGTEDSVRGLRALVDAAGPRRAALGDSPVLGAALAALDGHDNPYGMRIAALARGLLEVGGKPVVGLGVWHGDWTEHNAAMVDEELVVWDWERFEDGAPVGFDELHRRFQSLAGGVPTVEHARAAHHESAQWLASLGVPAATAPQVALAYLVTIAARYVVDDQRGHGSPAGAVETWLLPLLDELAEAASVEVP